MEEVINSQEKQVNVEANPKQGFDYDKTNILLTIALKVVLLGILIASFTAGKSIYEQYAHYGPKCSENMSSFQYWIDSGKQLKGKVVSVHTSRLQTENGTTQCYGQFLTEKGMYKDWTGSISELSNKKVVGWAKVQN